MSDQSTPVATKIQPTAKAIITGNGMAIVVDEADYPLVSAYVWHAHKSKNGAFYARGTVAGRRVMMHVFLMGSPTSPGLTVDHKNGHTLDNRRSNLRWATRSEQARNQHYGRGRSIYKGVTWKPSHRKWLVTIGASDGKNKHVGYFDNECEAARAYDAVALEYFGEFASLNFPVEEVAND